MMVQQGHLKPKPIRVEGNMYERQARQAQYYHEQGMSDEAILKTLGYDRSLSNFK